MKTAWKKPPRPQSNREYVQQVVEKHQENARKLKNGTLKPGDVKKAKNRNKRKHKKSGKSKSYDDQTRKKVTRRERFRKYHEQLFTLPRYNKTSLIFTVYDFGSHQVFQSLQNMFITKYSLYLFVFNLTDFTYLKKIHRSRKFFEQRSRQALQELSFWLNSVRINSRFCKIIIFIQPLSALLGSLTCS